MPLNEREIKELEERFERLDDKLKTTFQEVEKRLEQLKMQPVDIMDRIQELEDLILLMQLEITKLKDRTSISTDYITPDTPSMMERLNRVEEAVSLREVEKGDAMGDSGERLFKEEMVEEGFVEDQGRKEKGKSLLQEVQEILSS